MLFSLMLAAASAVQQPAAPLPAPAQDDQTIVVTGERASRETIKDFVRALTAAGPPRQISRFESSVCPAVFGLARQQADAVAARMRRVANGVGIRTAGPGCAPNVVVLVTPDKQVLLKELYRQRPDYFGSPARGRLKAALRQPGPASAWQLQGPEVNARGVEIHQDEATGWFINRTTEPASRMSMPARPQFGAAVVVVEGSALAGLTLTQLGDYAAMRAYSGADPARLPSSAPTILRVVDAPLGSEVPVTMTSWDFSFLRGLYAGDWNLFKAAQQSAIARAMARDLQPAQQ